MHDNYIVSYSVDIEKKTLSVKTFNDYEKKEEYIHFSEVLTHSFECIIDYNIISDICEYEVGSFIDDNREELKKMQGFCWPMIYDEEEELREFLISNGYKYVMINSSYGMSGWVLAKRYEIVG